VSFLILCSKSTFMILIRLYNFCLPIFFKYGTSTFAFGFKHLFSSSIFNPHYLKRLTFSFCTEICWAPSFYPNQSLCLGLCCVIYNCFVLWDRLCLFMFLVLFLFEIIVSKRIQGNITITSGLIWVSNDVSETLDLKNFI
jgi:hypothetical protein